MRGLFFWTLGVVGLFCAVVAFFIINPAAGSQSQAPAVQERNTSKESGYGVSETIYTLSDGRKVICLQAPYGALWCTPTLDK